MLPLEPLRALYWAETHMREARDAANHLIAISQSQTDLIHCLYTGIVVTYARSFGENQGLSRIPRKFREFTDVNLQKLHDRLLETRDTMYAHRDIKKEGALLPPGSCEED